MSKRPHEPAVPLSAQLLAIDLGGLAERTASDPAFAQQLAPLLLEALGGPGWHGLTAGSTEHATCCRLLGLDVEMIERRSDRVRLPVKAALVQLELTSTFACHDGAGSKVLFNGLVDPSVIDPSWAEGDGSAFDFKEEITGLTRQMLLDAKATGGCTPLSVLQTLCTDSMHSCTFLVGHNLPSDLTALRLRPPAVRRRLVDTQALFPTDSGGKAKLKALVENMLLPRDPVRWDGFQLTTHSPVDDARAAMLLVARELELCSGHLQRELCAECSSGRARTAAASMSRLRSQIQEPTAAAPAANESHFFINDADAGKVVSKGGSVIGGIRSASGAHIELANRAPRSRRDRA